MKEQPGGYVYVLATRAVAAPIQDYLARVLPGDLLGGARSWSWWAGSGWGVQANAVAIFTDPNGTGGPTASWDAGIGRFLLTTAHDGEEGGIGVFESASLEGPWSWIDYEDRWLGLSGESLGYSFPIKWISNGGETLGTVFSCSGSTTCTTATGVNTHDHFTEITGTLSMRPAGGAVAPLATGATVPHGLGPGPGIDAH